MLLNLETIYIYMYMLKNVKYAKICKISLYFCNRDFMNRIYVTLGYNSGYVKKICQVINIRALHISKTRSPLLILLLLL
jgi:hypothetical protein